MRTIAIGDVHGCVDDLRELLRAVDYRPGVDRCVLLGDLVDRGPDSRGVIRVAMEEGLESIMGNHDEKHVRHSKRMALHPDSRVGFRTEAERGFYATLSPDELSWLQSLPLMLRLGPRLVAVHAGVLPGVAPEVQLERVLLRCRYVERRRGKDGVERWEMARMRMTDDGGFLRPVGSVPWMEVWDGVDSVVYGHDVSRAGPRVTPTNDPAVSCYGIDTGACFGVSLTAAIWEDTGLPPEFVSIPASTTCEDIMWWEGTYDPDVPKTA